MCYEGGSGYSGSGYGGSYGGGYGGGYSGYSGSYNVAPTSVKVIKVIESAGSSGYGGGYSSYGGGNGWSSGGYSNGGNVQLNVRYMLSIHRIINHYSKIRTFFRVTNTT